MENKKKVSFIEELEESISLKMEKYYSDLYSRYLESLISKSSIGNGILDCINDSKE